MKYGVLLFILLCAHDVQWCQAGDGAWDYFDYDSVEFVTNQPRWSRLLAGSAAVVVAGGLGYIAGFLQRREPAVCQTCQSKEQELTKLRTERRQAIIAEQQVHSLREVARKKIEEHEPEERLKAQLAAVREYNEELVLEVGRLMVEVERLRKDTYDIVEGEES